MSVSSFAFSSEQNARKQTGERAKHEKANGGKGETQESKRGKWEERGDGWEMGGRWVKDGGGMERWREG